MWGRARQPTEIALASTVFLLPLQCPLRRSHKTPKLSSPCGTCDNPAHSRVDY